MSDHEQTRLQQAYSFNQATLAGIYDEYQQPIYRYIYRQVSDVETTRDLTADVFRRFLEALQKGNGPSQKLGAWLYRTAHNAVVDYYRRRQHRQHVPLAEDVIDVADDPVRQAESHISVEQVQLALKHLTLDQRQVIILKFLEGFSNPEIAAILEKPVGAVKSLQHRALAALQRHLTPAKEKMVL